MNHIHLTMAHVLYTGFLSSPLYFTAQNELSQLNQRQLISAADTQSLNKVQTITEWEIYPRIIEILNQYYNDFHPENRDYKFLKAHMNYWLLTVLSSELGLISEAAVTMGLRIYFRGIYRHVNNSSNREALRIFYGDEELSRCLLVTIQKTTTWNRAID
jgi:hypothetical protein